MKITTKVLLSCLLTISLGLAISAQQSQEQQQPSLAETLKWLSEKLRDDAGFIDGNIQERIDLIDFHECTVGYRWTHLETISDVKIGIWLKLQFPLTTIDPDSIKVVSLRGQYHCAITSTKTMMGTSELILPSHESVTASKHQKEIMRAGSGLAGLLPKSEYEFTIPFPEKEIAERFVKALTHAVRLCKAKKEPF